MNWEDFETHPKNTTWIERPTISPILTPTLLPPGTRHTFWMVNEEGLIKRMALNKAGDPEEVEDDEYAR